MPFCIQVLLLSPNQVTTDDCEYYITTLDLVLAERASERNEIAGSYRRGDITTGLLAVGVAVTGFYG